MSKMVWTGTRIDQESAWAYAEIKRRPDTSKVMDHYEVQDEYWSILGMMAFSVWSGHPLVLLTPDEPSDFGEDFRLFDFKIDIKATVHPNGKLVYRWGTRHPGDVYVLTLIHRPTDDWRSHTASAVGWAWHHELINGESVDWGHKGKPAHVLPQPSLHLMSDLRTDLCLEHLLASQN